MLVKDKFHLLLLCGKWIDANDLVNGLKDLLDGRVVAFKILLFEEYLRAL